MNRSQLLRPLALAGACLALGATAAAQDFNIDVSVLSGTPGATYGAGAAQPGFWNAVDGSAIGTVFPLQDLGGAVASAEVSYQIYGNSGGNFSFDNPGTTGDDEALLDDLQDIGSGTSLAIWTFTKLDPGNYDVYTYAWAPDDPSNSTARVRVVGSPDPEQSLGGPWTGSHVQGVTYALHSVVVGANGQLVVEVQPTSGFASLNGLQLVEGGSGTGPAKFCTSKVSSVPGCVPVLDGPAAQVSKTAGSGTYDITAQPTPGGGNPGILIYTTNGLLASPASTPFGALCLNQFLRAGFPAVPGGTTGACNGAYTWNFGQIIGALGTVTPGSTLHVQAWYRDPPNGGGANLTEGIGPIAVLP